MTIRRINYPVAHAIDQMRRSPARLAGLVFAALAIVSAGSQALAQQPTRAANEVRVALVIANGAYQTAGALANPIFDGRLIAQSLRDARFTKVVLLENQDRIGMERALREFAVEAERADVAMIYYAGHGIEYNGENYLIPVDAKLANERDLDIEAVKLSTLERMAEGAHRLRIIVLDACRTPPSGLKRQASSRSISRGLAPIEPAGDSLVIYSAKAGTTAADGNGKNSPFAQALARRIIQPGREISIMLRQVRDDVLKDTNGVQEPFTYGSLSSNEFYFIPATSAAAGGTSLDPESESWVLCRDSRTQAPCESYLRDYKSGRFASLATRRLGEFPGSTTTMPAVAAILSEAVPSIGLQVHATSDRAGIYVESVSKAGAAFGQLLPGDIITAINSAEVKRSETPVRQLDGALGAGPVKLLVQRGPTSTLVILRR